MYMDQAGLQRRIHCRNYEILDRLDKGLPPLIYGDGKQAYDFVNVVDCAKANIAAMKAKHL